MRSQPDFSREPSSLKFLEHSAMGMLIIELLGFHFSPLILLLYCFFIKELKCQDISALLADSKGMRERWWRAPKQTQEGMFGYLSPHSSAEARVGFSVGPWACSGTGYCSQGFPQQRMLLKEFSIPFPFKAHLKTAVVLAKEERIQASPITLTAPLEQLHLLGGVDNLKSDITPINNILCPSVSQSQRVREWRWTFRVGS